MTERIPVDSVAKPEMQKIKEKSFLCRGIWKLTYTVYILAQFARNYLGPKTHLTPTPLFFIGND